MTDERKAIENFARTFTSALRSACGVKYLCASYQFIRKNAANSAAGRAQRTCTEPGASTRVCRSRGDYGGILEATGTRRLARWSRSRKCWRRRESQGREGIAPNNRPQTLEASGAAR